LYHILRIPDKSEKMISASTTSPRPSFHNRVAGSLRGMLVGDALAMPAHWFYSPTKLRHDYGEIQGMVAPKPTHAESMVQGMSYKGTIDIMHDKARFYEGNTVAAEEQKLSAEEIAARRDDHGNFVGAVESERVHYHHNLKKGQNTANSCIARLAMRYISRKNAVQPDSYDPDEFLQHFYDYMTMKPDPNDKNQLMGHNDTYLDTYCRGFFTKASVPGTPLRECALSQRDTWSIGSLDGVVLAMPIIAAYANEPEWYVVGRAVEHHMLTHRSVTVTACISVLVPLLLELYHSTEENRADRLLAALDRAMKKMRPPKITGQEMCASYRAHHGPGGIPRDEKWQQHMVLEEHETTYDLVHRMLDWDDDDVAGFAAEKPSRLGTACYCEHAFTIVLYLAYKYGAHDSAKALLANVMIGGHSTARGAILGAILGAAHGNENIPFVEDLCALDAINQEVNALVSTLA
jgi:ADP-ribosyl-[dinitrogen reductase] hydrolase